MSCGVAVMFKPVASSGDAHSWGVSFLRSCGCSVPCVGCFSVLGDLVALNEFQCVFAFCVFEAFEESAKFLLTGGEPVLSGFWIGVVDEIFAAHPFLVFLVADGTGNEG